MTRENLESVGSVLDVTPTILAMLGIPAGEDMEGRVMSDVFWKIRHSIDPRNVLLPTIRRNF